MNSELNYLNLDSPNTSAYHHLSEGQIELSNLLQQWNMQYLLHQLTASNVEVTPNIEGDTEDPNQTWLKVYVDEWHTILIKWKETCALRQNQIKLAGANITPILSA